MAKTIHRIITNLALLLLLPSIVSAQTVTNGVSHLLAQQRKAAISNITYRLSFDIPAEKSVPVSGIADIYCSLKNLTTALQLDFQADSTQLISIQVNGRIAAPILRSEHIIIDKTFLLTGKNHIRITFTAGNTSLNRNNDYLYTLLVPERARSVFPCFDQPDLKAVFVLTLTVPSAWKVLANAHLKDAVTRNERSTYHFLASDKLPTYLFSFTAGLYSQKEKEGMQFLFRETDSSKISMSLDSIFQAHKNAFAFMQGWTGISYPFQKTGFVAIPAFQFGGMEHPGAVQYNASALFLDAAATRDQQLARSALISHETAHMWFGDMVTMQWFNDVWMKEVFANFMADKVTERWLGNETFQLKFLLDHTPAAYSVDRTPGANAIRQQLDNLQDAGSMYGNIIYHKAPIMMRQLELLMGKAAFRSGVQHYLRTYRFGNATWNDLVAKLQKYTLAELARWNQVWVQRPGRPVFDYHLTDSLLTITQQAERGETALWPQQFSVTLLYPDNSNTMIIAMNSISVSMALPGKPSAIVFNTDGMGYGLFPATLTDALFSLPDPIQRAAAYINAYENMLANRGIRPMDLLRFFMKAAVQEKNELLLRTMSNYIGGLYWSQMSAQERSSIGDTLENTLWNAMLQQRAANMKKILFGTYQAIYQSNAAAKKMVGIWQQQQPPDSFKLAEDDYTSMALTIALKTDTANNIVQQQLERISNPDRKARLAFLLPATSPDTAVRQLFIKSLTDSSNRRKEAWVIAGLSLVHHPLRQASAASTLPSALDMLEEIKRTGDIFFPQNWLTAIFSNYQSAEAWQVVSEFLAKHDHYNPLLKAKILQATDNLRRAQERNR